MNKILELLDYIAKNNGWKNHIDRMCDSTRDKTKEFRHELLFKYVDITFDTRDNQIFVINFRESKKKFFINNEEDLQKVYEWLDYDMEKNNG